MQEILRLVEAYGQPGFSAQSPHALAQGLVGGELCREPVSYYLAKRGPAAPFVQRVDAISSNLAYVQLAFEREGAWRTEVLGLIRQREGWRLLSLLWADSPDAFSNLYPGPAERQAGDAAALYDMLLAYCAAVYNLDAPGAVNLFAQGAMMEHPSGEGEVTCVPITVLHQRWEGLEHPSKSGIPQFTRIFHVEMLGGDTAFAKLGVSKLLEQYNDYLSCVRLDGRWVIVNKMTELLHRKSAES